MQEVNVRKKMELLYIHMYTSVYYINIITVSVCIYIYSNQPEKNT